MTDSRQGKSNSGKFIPAQPSAALLALVQNISKLDLHWRNRVIVSESDLATLQSIPPNNGVILTPNHADEMDPRICFEISRRANRRFIYMCNREAFGELHGMAGWFLQRIGLFSVERGGHDEPAKRFATEVLKDGRDTLVIFPEGEIFYLNESIQPFHSGAIEIGMQAIIEKRKQDPDWTSYLLPMCIKYRYREPLHHILAARVKKMEEHLTKGMTGYSLNSRLSGVMAELVRQEELKLNLESGDGEMNQLALRLQKIRHSLLNEVGKKHKGAYSAQARTIDQSFQLAAKVREQLASTQSLAHQTEYQQDLSKLTEVEHLVSLQPDYVDVDPSPERMAELVIKLERELFKVKRPSQLGKRDVYIKIGTPIDLGPNLPEYMEKPHVVRHKVAESLRAEIQSFIDILRQDAWS